MNILLYIINWLISFLGQRKQRAVVDGYRTKYVSINRGVPQGTVLGPVVFAIFINDIKAVNTNKNLLVKFADDITVSLPIEANVGLDESETEVLSFIEWSENNCMKVNLSLLLFVALNQFLLIDVSLIVTNIYLVVFLMYCFAFLYSFYCNVNCCTSVCAMNYLNKDLYYYYYYYYY